MHALHCILVPVEPESYEDMKEEALQSALSETECFRGTVFDWREEGPGNWKEEQEGVVLGAEAPKEFVKLLEQYSKIALGEISWQTRNINQEVLKLFCSLLQKGKYKELWELQESAEMDLWRIGKILASVNGEYQFSSQFNDTELGQSRLNKKRRKEVLENVSNYALVFLDYHL